MRLGFALGAACLVGVSCGGLVEPRVEPPPARICPARFAECDGNDETICETDLASSSAHCGACGAECPVGLFCGPRGCVDGQTVVQVGGAAFATCARTARGELFCWGRNEFGQLGDGTQIDRPTPIKVAVSDVAEISSEGGRTVCTRQRNGSGSCAGWYLNGLDTERLSLVPERIVGLDHIAVLETTGIYACAVQTDGGVWCWGNDRCGWLGNDTGASYLYDGLPRRVDVPRARDIALATGAC